MNKLIKYIFVVLLFLTAGVDTYGQMRPIAHFRRFDNRRINQDPENKIEAVQERFIRMRLNLTPAQAAKFFPLYQEYHRELFNIRRLKRLNNTNAQANGTEQINRELNYDDQILKIKMRFKDAFLKVLPPEKVSELYKSEREFNDELVRQLSERSAKAGN